MSFKDYCSKRYAGRDPSVLRDLYLQYLGYKKKISKPNLVIFYSKSITIRYDLCYSNVAILKRRIPNYPTICEEMISDRTPSGILKALRILERRDKYENNFIED